ncbi:MAG: SDR family oxidoreductase [Halobacteriaceae archaeon]
MDLGFDGHAALVTASSSGLGKASATALAREGCDVVLNGRDEERLAAAVDEVREAAAPGVTVVGQPTDLTDPDAGEVLVERALGEFGRLDHLVTSTGGPPPGGFADTTDEDWYDAFDLLVMSVVRTVRAASEPLAADGGGTIVTVTSRTVKEAATNITLSSSVRMAVIGLEKVLSEELAPEVRSNAVLPGAHETPRIQELMEDAVERGEFDSYEAAREARADDIPVGFVGDPMDLGEVVAFLSSERSRYVDGAAIPIDGGAHASNL